MQNMTGSKAFTASAAIAQHLRVKLTSGKLALAGASDKELGVTETKSFADGDSQTVRLRSAEGTLVGVAAGAIAVGDEIFAAASGKVDDSGSVSLGVALTPATADGDQIEWLRY
jgi:hypothetical protein